MWAVVGATVDCCWLHVGYRIWSNHCIPRLGLDSTRVAIGDWLDKQLLLDKNWLVCRSVGYWILFHTFPAS